METKGHLCFLKKAGGRCGSVYGTKGAVDRKSLGTTALALCIKTDGIILSLKSYFSTQK
jgi:hypothetical protein